MRRCTWRRPPRTTAITLDVMLPDCNGFTLYSEFRRRGVTTPVLVITALDTIHDRVTGLDSGADDYLADLLLSCWAVGPAASAGAPTP